MLSKEYSSDKHNREIFDYSAILKKDFGLSGNQTFGLSQECDTIVKRHSRTHFESQELFTVGNVT